MKTQRSSSKSGLFLIELIIAIVFFAVASAICIQLFVQAHLISGRSRDLSVATSIAQNQAELFKAGAMELPTPEEWQEPVRLEQLYDSTGAPVAEGSDTAFYRLTGSVSLQGDKSGLRVANLEVYRASGTEAETRDAICRLEVKDYDEQSIG